MTGLFTADDFAKREPSAVRSAYFELSVKKPSSASISCLRSDFIAVMYALPLVLANFGIAIAARMPMMTTTIRSSMRVNPLRLRNMGGALLEMVRGDHYGQWT